MLQSSDQPLGLLSLPDDLLVQVVQHCNAKDAARAAVTCHRLLAARAAVKQEHAVFSGSMVYLSDEECAADEAAAACDDALNRMPATVDFALAFIATPTSEEDVITPVLNCLRRRLPPGTKVVGCTGRGIMGVLPDGSAAEIDPSLDSRAGLSLLLGRVPGAQVHTFAARRTEGAWDSEPACRKWLGLRQELQPLSLTLFTRSGCSYLIEQCLDGMHAAFPGMVITGGIASGRRNVFCTTASAPPPAPHLSTPAKRDTPADTSVKASTGLRKGLRPRRTPCSLDTAASDAAVGQVNEAADKHFVGLVLCAPTCPTGPLTSVAAGAGTSSSGLTREVAGAVSAGAFTARGLCGLDPVFHDINLARGLGNFVDGHGQEMEMVAVTSAHSQGVLSTDQLSELVEAYGDGDLALWVAGRASPGTYSERLTAAKQIVVLKTMSYQEGVLGAVHPSQTEAFDELLRAAEQPRQTLCGQVLVVASDGYLREFQAYVPSLATLSSRCTGSSSHAGSGSRACNALVVVSCTAKGAEMYEGEEGVEARQLLQIGKMPLVGVYCDGEIGPAPLQGQQSGVCWAASGGSSSGGRLPCQAADAGTKSRLQGFTTIVSVMGS